MDAPTLQRITAHSEAPWRGLFTFLLETGCRYQEGAALTWECVPDETRVEVKPHALPDGTLWRPKRPSSVRALRVPPGTLPDRADASEGDLVFFPGASVPTTVRSANRALAKAARELNLPRPTTHAFRRARIAQALAAGADPNTVRAAVGHRSLITTVGYLRDVPVRAELPPLGADAVSNPVAAQYLNLARSKVWK